MPLTLRYVARSDVGLVREGNEDSGYAGPYLLAVADGMGGHAAGEVASQAAIDELIHADRPPSDSGPMAVLSTAVMAANDRIRELAEHDLSRQGMGTTVTSMLWDGSSVTIGHIGDSRAYRLRGDTLTQVTRDHTFVQSLVDDGRISVEDARAHPARSVVTNVLQGQPSIEPDYSALDAQPGDRLMICSDGLSDFVSDTAIEDAIRTADTPADAADALIELALEAGAPDNVTVVLADVVDAVAAHHSDDTAEAFLVGAAAGEVDNARQGGTDQHADR